MTADAELALHVLAQLDDRACLEIEGTAETIAGARRLSAAYGLEGRARFVERGVGRTEVPRARIRIDGVEHSCSGGSFASVVHGLADGAKAPTQRGDDGVLRDARIALVTNRPAHYRIPLLTGLSHRLRAAGATFRVYFLESESPDRPWLVAEDAVDFEHEFLPSLVLPLRRHRRPSVPTRVGKVFDRFQPTIALIAGLSPPVAGRLTGMARRVHSAVGVWSGEIARSETARGQVRRLFRRRVLARVDFGIAYGWESARYLRMLAPALPVVVGRNTSRLPEPVRHRQVSRPRLIAVGDLASERKGMDVLLDALALRPRLNCELRIVGGGRLLPALAARAKRDPRVTLLGPLQPADTRAEMARSDVYLFPTRFDLFGLSLVEAMGCGLASVVTPYAGAVEDLCVPGINCVLVDGDDPRRWAEALDRLAEDSGARASLGRAAAATVAARWTLDHAVDAMIAGLRLGATATR